MTHPNLLPAILLAGPPHCGKSVLSFLLTQYLREKKVLHYLLRAAPDGEGDWFTSQQTELVRAVRLGHKRAFNERFVNHMQQAIQNRLLPLLVDTGGKPCDSQFHLLRACTHSILLYRDELDHQKWRALLSGMNLLPLAELRSDLAGKDAIEQLTPVLEGVISSLARDENLRRTGEVFALLAERVAGICRYDVTDLETGFFNQAPLPVVNERDLATLLDVPFHGENPYWDPIHLAGLGKLSLAGRSAAIYGRGPTWLAVCLAVLALPGRAALFDARFGWVMLPQLRQKLHPEINICCTHLDEQAIWIEITLSKSGNLSLDEMALPEPEGEGGLVLSGKLPRWYFATLARHYSPKRPWVAIYDPHLCQAVVVSSQNESRPLGSVFTAVPPEIE